MSQKGIKTGNRTGPRAYARYFTVPELDKPVYLALKRLAAALGDRDRAAIDVCIRLTCELVQKPEGYLRFLYAYQLHRTGGSTYHERLPPLLPEGWDLEKPERTGADTMAGLNNEQGR